MKLQRVLILAGAAVVLTWAGMHIRHRRTAAGALMSEREAPGADADPPM